MRPTFPIATSFLFLAIVKNFHILTNTDLCM